MLKDQGIITQIALQVLASPINFCVPDARLVDVRLSAISAHMVQGLSRIYANNLTAMQT